VTVLGVADLILAQAIPKPVHDAVPRFYELLPGWEVSVWIAVSSLCLLAAVVEASFRQTRDLQKDLSDARRLLAIKSVGKTGGALEDLRSHVVNGTESKTDLGTVFEAVGDDLLVGAQARTLLRRMKHAGFLASDEGSAPLSVLHSVTRQLMMRGLIDQEERAVRTAFPPAIARALDTRDQFYVATDLGRRVLVLIDDEKRHESRPQQQRQARIEKWRRQIGDYRDAHDADKSPGPIREQDFYQEVRPHLSEQAIDFFEPPPGRIEVIPFVGKPPPQPKHPAVDRLLQELAALEKKWGLI